MTEFLARMEQAVVTPVTQLFIVGEQTYWVSYLGAALIAALYYCRSRRGRRTSFRGLRHYVMPRRLFTHPSTRLDFKFYVFTTILVAAQPLLIFGTMPVLGDYLFTQLTGLIGPASHQTPMPTAMLILLPLLMFLTYEFGYWLAHFLMHRTPWLWEFHKAHHSAEVMTPLTEWRQHPIEYLVFPAITSSLLSIVYAWMRWAYGPELQLLPFWNMNVILFVFILTLVHLRHTHIRMAAPGILAYIIQTPAHHHIHHSTEPRHFDKNLGYSLAVWDWVFGTLYLPEKNQRITFGIGDHAHATTYRLRDHLIAPFRESGKMALKKLNILKK